LGTFKAQHHKKLLKNLVLKIEGKAAKLLLMTLGQKETLAVTHRKKKMYKEVRDLSTVATKGGGGVRREKTTT
jgi:hypothetical protein